MKNAIIIMAILFMCCIISALPMKYYAKAEEAAETGLANAEETQGGETALENETPDTGENNANNTYITQFSVETRIQTKQNAEGKTVMWINTPVVYDENVLSVDFVTVEAYFPKELKISKTTTQEKNYYYLTAEFDKWTDPNRVLYPKIRVKSSGSITYHENAKISSITTDIPEEPEPLGDIDKDKLLEELMTKVDGLIAEQESEGLDKLWEIIRPFVIYVLSALMSGVIVANIISAAIKKKYDVKEIADKVTENLAGKDISIDIETVTKHEIATIGAALQNNLTEGLQGVENMKRSVALLCNALSKSKTLTQEERERLAAEAKKLDKEVAEEAREKIVVRLEKAQEPEKQSEETAAGGGLFDYLGK